jgi:hypothetical protein
MEDRRRRIGGRWNRRGDLGGSPMKDYAATLDPRAGQQRTGPQLVPPRGSVINVNCGGAADSASALDSFESQADQYLGEQTKPLFSVPLWVWLGIAGLGAAWWFWGRKHFKITAI